jgi:predicted ATPase
MPTRAQAPAVPRLTYLRIKNYRSLRDVEFRDLTPLTVLIGPNGSGKSTVLDALDFLAEAVRGNLVGAWEKRERFRGIRTRESEENIRFELEIVVENSKVRYELEFEEFDKHDSPRIFVVNEVIQNVRRGEILCKLESKYFGNNEKSSFYPFLNIYTYSTEPEDKSYVNPDYLFVAVANTRDAAGGIEARESALIIKSVLSSYRYIHLTDDHLKGYSDAGPREKLSPNGDNLPNVLYYLHTKHPETLAKITAQMRKWVPGLADVVPEITSDERILLRFKDAEFEKPMPAQYMSGGTMRLTALLTLLHEPDATGLLGIEEPENELHPQLLYRLTEEFEKAAEKRQLFVTTHSPLLLDALAPEQVWVMYRGADGYSHAVRTADMPNVPELVEDGSMLGYLWTSNTFTAGDPQAPSKATPDAR